MPSVLNDMAAAARDGGTGRPLSAADREALRMAAPAPKRGGFRAWLRRIWPKRRNADGNPAE